MTRNLSYSSLHKNNSIIPDGTIVTVSPPASQGSSGSSGSSGYTPPPGDYTSITAALESLQGKILLGTVTIQVNDGVYDEPSLLFSDPELSGRLIITGNINVPSACVINTIPDPNFGFKLSALGGDRYDLSDSEVNQNKFDGGYGLDYSTVSEGIFLTNNFLLRMGGFTIQGSLVNGTNITRRAITVIKGSQLYCPDNSMVLNTGLDAFAVGDNSMIYMRFANISNFVGTTINAFLQGIACLDGSTIVGPGESYTGFTITDPKVAFIYDTGIAAGVAIPAALAEISSGSLVYIDSSSISGFPYGADINDSSYLFVPFSTISNIGDTNGCLKTYMGAYTLADTCTFNNVSLPFSGSSSFVTVQTAVAATGIVRGLFVSGGSISANGSNAVFGSVPTPYSPNSNNVATGDGSLLFYS